MGHVLTRPGVRDSGLLESDLYRPQSSYYQDLSEMAAAMFESLINNHPFIDGNKRMAFFATDTFLRSNGYKLQVKARTAHAFLVQALEQRSCKMQVLLPWIRQSIQPL